MAVSIFSLGVAALLLLLGFIAPMIRAKPKAFRIGKDPGLFGFSVAAAKREFANYGHQLVERGYQEVRRALSPPSYRLTLRLIDQGCQLCCTNTRYGAIGHCT